MEQKILTSVDAISITKSTFAEVVVIFMCRVCKYATTMLDAVVCPFHIVNLDLLDYT